MIGLPGILIQALMLGGVIFFAVAPGIQLRAASTWRNTLLALIFMPLSLVALWRETTHALYLRSLRELRSQEVAQIVINGNSLDGERKEAIIGALNQSVWFEPKHGGWRRPSDIYVTLKSGSTMHLSVALYRSGAVILGRGDAFSASLPSALSDVGFPLSDEVNR